MKLQIKSGFCLLLQKIQLKLKFIPYFSMKPQLSCFQIINKCYQSLNAYIIMWFLSISCKKSTKGFQLVVNFVNDFHLIRTVSFVITASSVTFILNTQLHSKTMERFFTCLLRKPSIVYSNSIQNCQLCIICHGSSLMGQLHTHTQRYKQFLLMSVSYPDLLITGSVNRLHLHQNYSCLILFQRREICKRQRRRISAHIV